MIEEQAFVDVVNRRGSMVYKLAFVHMKSECDAEDIYQIVFERYLRYEPEFNDDEHEKAWFIVATINACRTMLTSSWNRHTVTLDDEGWQSVLSEYSKSNMTTEDNAVIEALLQLSDRDRVILQLFYYEEYSVKEIARMMEIKVGTVTTRLNRARKKMEKLLRGRL
ncbi:MAG: sigma-70 family RNA polymerase sigma factor [Lachnospira sp.]|nr:sigma-70 family RNA polymerase sigma factor [Lachnospira sp.]